MLAQPARLEAKRSDPIPPWWPLSMRGQRRHREGSDSASDTESESDEGEDSPSPTTILRESGNTPLPPSSFAPTSSSTIASHSFPSQSFASGTVAAPASVFAPLASSRASSLQGKVLRAPAAQQQQESLSVMPLTAWSDYDRTRMRMMIDNGATAVDIAHALNRPVAEVHMMVPHVGQEEHRLVTKSWTDAEVALLQREVAAGTRHDQIALMLNRTIWGVRAKLWKLRRDGVLSDEGPMRPGILHRWSASEEQLLMQELDAGTPIDKIAEMLHRSPLACLTKRVKLRKLQSVREKRKLLEVAWSESDDQQLREMAMANKTVDEMATTLRRQVPDVLLRLRTIPGLRTASGNTGASGGSTGRRRGFNHWTESEMKILAEDLANDVSPAEISVKLGRSYEAVKAKVLHLRRSGSLPVPGGFSTYRSPRQQHLPPPRPHTHPSQHQLQQQPPPQMLQPHPHPQQQPQQPRML